MNLTDTLQVLGYHQKWLDFGILTDDLLAKQIVEFEQGYDKNTEHYRYATLLKFIQRDDHFADDQIQKFITLVEQDSDRLMAGSALKALYEYGKLTPSQVKIVEHAFINFGDWTAKIIEQNRLMTALNSLLITPELVAECIAFKKTYQSNMLLQILIEKTENKAILEQFTTLEFGRTIRNLAKQKLKRL